MDSYSQSTQRTLTKMAADGDLTGVRASLAGGADANAVDDAGETPLGAAARIGHAAIARLLLTAGADPWLEVPHTSSGTSLPISCAGRAGARAAAVAIGRAMRGRRDARWLQDWPEWLETALSGAADGEPAWAAGLLAAGANPDGMPLIMAIQCDEPGIVGLLIAAGAEVNRPFRRTTPLIHAVVGLHPSIVELLLLAGADPEQPDARGRTPLAALYGEVARGRPPGSRERIAALLRAHWATDGPNPEGRSRDGRLTASPSVITSLVQHAQAGDLTGVRASLAAGADPNAYGPARDTPLGAAARIGHAAIVRLLLAHGADPWLPDGDRLPVASAGMVDAWAAAVAIGRAMRDRLPNTWLAQHPGWLETALAEAVRQYPAWVMGLLAAGADPDGAPLLQAVKLGSVGTVDLLLAVGADVNRANDGMTPLVESVRGLDCEAVERLLIAGADPDQPDGQGRTPLATLAERAAEGRPGISSVRRITALLRSYGATK